MRPGPITSTCFPPEGADGYCTIETFDPENRRATLEITRCRTDSGRTEFNAEVSRVESIHAKEKDIGSTVVRLMDPWELEIDRKEIAS
jgi:hypothetical protein